MPLKNLCREMPICIGPKATVKEAARLMKSRGVGDLVVVANPGRPKAPIGIVTDRDIVLKAVASDGSLDELTVEDVMSKDLRFACTSDGVFEATEAFETTAVRRLTVVDDRGNLKGIIAIDDLYELLATELGNLSRVSARQFAKEGGGFSRGRRLKARDEAHTH